MSTYSVIYYMQNYVNLQATTYTKNISAKDIIWD